MNRCGSIKLGVNKGPFLAPKIASKNGTVTTLSAQSTPFTEVRFGNSLKEVRIRIKSVKSIEKITKTMKMIASSRLKGTQNRLQKARPFFDAPAQLFEELKDDSAKNQLYFALTTDRGLCGGINTNLAKMVRQSFSDETKKGNSVKLVIIGDKGVPLIGRQYGKDVLTSVHETTKKNLFFAGIGVVLSDVLKDAKFDSATVFYNKFINVISYKQSTITIPSAETMRSKKELSVYEFEDDNSNFHTDDLFEFGLASAIYYATCENGASELSARVSAMESASKNASEMLKRLNIFYNRGRQAAITTELTEIVAGASAIQD